MTTFAEAVEWADNTTLTENGMGAFKSTLNANVDLFFKIGASRGKDITDIFVAAFKENPEFALRTAMWVRDVRGGAGERQLFRDILKHVEKTKAVPGTVMMNIVSKMSELGRWDDLLIFEDEEVKRFAFSLIREALNEGNGLCAKWMPRKGATAVELRKYLELSPKQYRKTLVNLTKVVETQMCAKDWTDINYGHVPSVAAARYQKAFGRHDEAGYTAYKEGLVAGTEKINADALYPYDVIKSLNHGDSTVAEAQWEALPNFLGDDAILPMVDISSSMTWTQVSPNLTPMDVAISLGLYIADKQTGPFGGLFMTFDSNPTLEKLKGETLKEKYNQLRNDGGWGSTNLEAAFSLLLDVAVKKSVSQEDMPKYLLMLSDMQFDQCTGTRGQSAVQQATALDMIKSKYVDAGYDVPTLVFWNLDARSSNQNVPVLFDEKGTVLISGFSPSIAKAVLAADESQLTPEGIMLKTIMVDRYSPFSDEGGDEG